MDTISGTLSPQVDGSMAGTAPIVPPPLAPHGRDRGPGKAEANAEAKALQL